jgi:hypothetical protein
MDPWTGIQPFPPHLRPYIPNAWGAKLSGGQALHGAMESGIIAKSIVLVTTRQVFQEEIFVDYRLDPTQPTPSWYVPINPDVDRRTWAAVRPDGGRLLSKHNLLPSSSSSSASK